MCRCIRPLAWFSAAALLATSLVSCVADEQRVAGPLLPTAAAARPAVPRLFAADSVWNRPLAADAPVDPSSPRLVAALVREVAREQEAAIGPWIQTRSYSTPVYEVPAAQPTVRVALDNAEPWAETLRAALRAVPIPRGARPAEGSDGHLTIWQRERDRLWELWQARKTPGGWHAAWGGAMEHVSRSPGYFTPASWPGARSYWGATATSLPVLGGTMRIAELKRGRIDHALAVSLPAVRAGAYAWPAQRTDGTDPSTDAIPEGARLRIDPALDVRSLYLPRLTEAMALAAQRYGMIVRDQTHNAIGFYAEDPTPTGSDPYPALMDYAYPTRLLADFPWEHVRVLRLELRQGTGRPG
jgi:hypothetical protein